MRVPCLILGVTLFSYYTLFSCHTLAQVYSYKDAEGRTIYSDQPPESGEYTMVKVKPVNQLQVEQAVKEATEKYHQDLQNERENLKEKRVKSETEAAEVREAVKNSENALIDAANIRSGDIIRNKIGGIRYTEQYKKRMLDAEKALQKTRQSLKRVNQGVELTPD